MFSFISLFVSLIGFLYFLCGFKAMGDRRPFLHFYFVGSLSLVVGLSVAFVGPKYELAKTIPYHSTISENVYSTKDLDVESRDYGTIFKSKMTDVYIIDDQEFIVDKTIKSNKYSEETLYVKTVTKTIEHDTVKDPIVLFFAKEKIITRQVILYQPKP